MKRFNDLGFRCAARALAIPAIVSALWCAGCSDDLSPSRPALAEADSTWTFMVYDAADCNAVSISSYFQAISTAHSGEYVNLLILQDTETTPTKIWHIDEKNQLVLLEDLGELSMGAEETLNDFVTYAKENYPADRYIMSFYGHGSAWFGCCGDATSQDALRMHEIKGALTEAGGVDLVFFSAPCLMGCVEAAYELKGCTQIFIASEALSGFYYWMNPVELIFETLHEDPTISGTALAELVIWEMWDHWEPTTPWGPDTLLTMCAVRTESMDGLKCAIDDVALAYLADTDTFKARVTAVFEDVARLAYYAVDLNSLVRQMLAVETNSEIKDKLAMIPERLEAAVIAECHSPNWQGVGGLSIFLPPSDFQWMSYYRGEEDIKLDFVSDTHWDELVEVLIEQPPALKGDDLNELLYLENGRVHRLLE